MIKYLFLIIIGFALVSCGEKETIQETNNIEPQIQVTPEQIDPIEDAGQVAAPEDFPQSLSEVNGGDF